MKRRTFLGLIASTGAGMLLPGGRTANAIRLLDKLDKIGFDLSGLESEMSRSVERSLAELSRIGFREVAFSGYFSRPPRAIRQLLDRNGLSAPSASVSLDTIRDRWLSTLDIAAEIGHRYLVVESFPQTEYGGKDQLLKAIDLVNQAAESAARFKIMLAYRHQSWELDQNHDFVPLDLLLSSTLPERIGIELNLPVAGGQQRDLSAYLSQWPGRFPLLRVGNLATTGLDARAAGEQLQTEKILEQVLSKKKQAGIAHVFAAVKDASDSPLTAASEQYNQLKAIRF